MSYKKWVFLAIFLFGIGLSLGLVITDKIANLFSAELTALKELSAILGPFQISTAAFIFIKNVSALLLSFVLAPIFCLLPVLALTFNGLLLSFVSSVAMREESLSFVLVGILPHGIFELPAFIIGEAASLSFGALVLLALVKKERRNLLLPGLKQNLRYLMIAFVLLLPAAIIETFVTPMLLS